MGPISVLATLTSSSVDFLFFLCGTSSTVTNMHISPNKYFAFWFSAGPSVPAQLGGLFVHIPFPRRTHTQGEVCGSCCAGGWGNATWGGLLQRWYGVRGRDVCHNVGAAALRVHLHAPDHQPSAVLQDPPFSDERLAGAGPPQKVDGRLCGAPHGPGIIPQAR